MTQDELKQAVARAALAYVVEGKIVGVGTGSTARMFIDALAEMKDRIAGAVASSEDTKNRLEAHGIKVFGLNEVTDLPVYIDGADEINAEMHMIKGGGGALTREKIVSAVAEKFVCIVDGTKYVEVLGRFPLPVEVIPMEERTPDTKDEVIVTGDARFPQWHMRLLAPEGPVGPSTNIENAPDYDKQGRSKEPGQVVTVLPNGKFGSSDFAAKHPRFYSIPEGMFSSFSGPAQRHTILQYTIEAQDYDWVPYVTGHFRAYGLELDADPLIIGSEVRLGDPLSGTLIARGFGNNSSWTTVVPHFSSTGNTTAAVAPDNGHAMVPAGQPAQINVNLYNDGLLGVYLFNPAGAQLDVLVIPQG